jgi:hypothetical protein
MRSQYNVTELNHCIVYTFMKDGIKQYILFGPDLSKFKQFNDGQELANYATFHNLILQFK